MKSSGIRRFRVVRAYYGVPAGTIIEGVLGQRGFLRIYLSGRIERRNQLLGDHVATATGTWEEITETDIIDEIIGYA